MKSKKAVSLSIETVIILILAVLALLVLLFIFSSGMRQIVTDILDKIKSVTGLWKAVGIE
jgi:cell division protein FtsL